MFVYVYYLFLKQLTRFYDFLVNGSRKASCMSAAKLTLICQIKVFQHI